MRRFTLVPRVVLTVLVFLLSFGVLPVFAAPFGQVVEAEATNLGALIGSLAAISVIVFAVAELVFAPWLLKDIWGDHKDGRAWTLQMVVAVIGATLCVGYRLDLVYVAVSHAGLSVMCTPFTAVIGQVLTGVLIGRGANWFHDFAGIFKPRSSSS